MWVYFPSVPDVPNSSPSPPSLQDVARLAKVSLSTASRALKNHPRISKATCLRVQKIATSCGYRANPVLTSLAQEWRKGRQSHYKSTLAYITSFPNASLKQGDAYYLFYCAAKERATQLGYTLESFWLKEPGMTGRRASTILKSRGIRGLLIANPPSAIGHLSLEWQSFAAVAVGFCLSAPHLHYVCNDHASSISLALRKLRHAGYQRIGLVVEPIADQYARGMFLATFLHYQHFLKASFRVPLFNDKKGSAFFTQAAFSDWFHKHQPDAILCVHPRIKAWVEQLGKKIPQDVALITLDLLTSNSKWTGIDARTQIVGTASVDLLVQELQMNVLGVPKFPKAILIEGRWQDGETYGLARTD
jgi:DNA-binding LacI/PurR family transcriptional regulator